MHPFNEVAIAGNMGMRLVSLSKACFRKSLTAKAKHQSTAAKALGCLISSPQMFLNFEA
jgi:hypothetical protein